MNKIKNLAKGMVLVTGLGVTQTTLAASTVNVGFMSDYVFRGVHSGESAAMAGFDHDFGNGFAAGAWLADIDNGIEYDIYGSYSGKINKEINYSIALNTYNYTDADDLDAAELDLKLGYGPLEVEFATGTVDEAAGDVDYNFIAITGNYKNAYMTLGEFGNDMDGSYFEIGYNTSFAGVDAAFALINNDEDLDVRSADGNGETILTLTLTKTFAVK